MEINFYDFASSAPMEYCLKQKATNSIRIKAQFHIFCENVCSLHGSQTMKNITLSVDDETYRLARIKAAEREQSVSAMVRDLIRGLAAKPVDDLAEKNARLLAAFAASKNFSVSDRLTREEIYDRSRRD